MEEGKILGSSEVKTEQSPEINPQLLPTSHLSIAEHEAVFSSNIAPMLVFDRSKRIVRMNNAAKKAFGQDFTGTSTAQLLHLYQVKDLTGKTLSVSETPIGCALKGQTVSGYVIEVQSGDGASRLMRIDAVPVFLRGEIVEAVAIFFDITESKRAEDNLRISEDRFHRVFDQSPIPAAILLPDFTLLRANEALCKLLDYTEKELKAMKFPEFTHPDDIQADVQLAKELITGKIEQYDLEKRYIRKDGTIVWGHLFVRYIKDRRGQILHILPMILDITSRKEAEGQLLQLTSELTQANQDLEAFSYSVAHDLRAPLRSINGFSKALSEDYGEGLDAQGRQYLEKINQSSAKMSQLIDDLLRLAKVTQSPLDIGRVNLTRLAERIIRTLREAEPHRSIDIYVEKELNAMGDANLFEILLNNLLRNAWKFTSKTKNPTIKIGKRTSDDHVIFFVEDNGVGFDPTSANTLFKPFVRLHGKEFTGSGIGLAIAQRIVSRHHGKIWAIGEVGKGATFFFSLPENAQI